MGRGTSGIAGGAGNSRSGEALARQLHQNAYHRDLDVNRVMNLRAGNTYHGDSGLAVTISRERVSYGGVSRSAYSARVVTPTYGGYFQSNYMSSLGDARKYAVDKVKMEYNSRDEEARRNRRR